jgi:hypothetical protein
MSGLTEGLRSEMRLSKRIFWLVIASLPLSPRPLFCRSAQLPVYEDAAVSQWIFQLNTRFD